ncbi:orotate phosphoribosyltransferase [Thalassobacillus sp. C254]|uniref:orotate phosphoribosyltransferase n=1 Tax=Thalassobacillus sp. C254 TaxID=1225341 RepID=UPI0006CFDCE1|nr:orotate phosphoribosyltransferase [Thalassobacillus sp. C254]
MKREIAQSLLSIDAVSLQPNEPFTWSSGIKSPIYCDNRLTLSFPEVRKQVADGLTQLVKDHYPEAEVIAGTATAGIPHAALVAERMGLPMIYVRGKSKSHGKGNQIEGVVKKGQKAVIIEDLISTGGSMIQVAEALREDGVEVTGAAAIFTYELEKGFRQLEEADLPFVTLTDYDTLIEIAAEQELIKPEDRSKLRIWKKDPADTSWMHS